MKTTRGFTLLEIIIAIFLFSILLMAGSYFSSSFFKSFKSILNKTNSIQIEQIVIRNITNDGRFATKAEGTKNAVIFFKKDSTVSYGIKNYKVFRKEDKYTSYITEENDIKTLNFEIINPKLVIFSVDGITSEVYCRN
ncbi:hypothetical protein A3J90_08730 [candidate division WOR-1 bacterium RIFOXYC2_FULL_37_10]|uniref:Prepilin-type N-terminal cleavage/methylation domain-containing protein n=1 Tax=candidate division WOR-1 bacterium RIFOXYB2_FULL_37_13 TaxID=1802579 RepID=A0A1F4SNK3_UNCSA|nr:MAG: hypothetical protein A2246_05565 [candidate division WOR-1 bacterium RIFOXYA2_FULL_37_7]OGC22032.1 MAG: hypothetical protein A2310_07010 [candidate division WOR-1 bacterium RIFOXYB2_FULL_37_13]OGC33060.1 MAG: hypothetical protein A3J90_08730 [candidate division WOR-1 bacterium RIFOXYC2_FULL_37_10]